MQKFRFKILFAIVCLVLLCAVLAGCGTAAPLKAPEALEGVTKYSVTGTCQIAVNGDTITVSGETDLMDGAIINVSVVAQDGMTIDSVTLPKSGNQISKDFQITGDKYEGVVSVTGYITCAPSRYGAQPDNVYAAYGKKFEYVSAPEGNYIWLTEGNIVLFASDRISLNQ